MKRLRLNTAGPALFFLASMQSACIVPISMQIEKPTCLFELNVERSQSVWPSSELPHRLPLISGKDGGEALVFAHYPLREPALFRVRAGSGTGAPEVQANADLFRELWRLDATRAAAAQTVAQLVDPGLLSQPALRRPFMAWLLESQIVLSYAHIEANLCLVSEETRDGAYRTDWKGHHIYFTN